MWMCVHEYVQMHFDVCVTSGCFCVRSLKMTFMCSLRVSPLGSTYSTLCQLVFSNIGPFFWQIIHRRFQLWLYFAAEEILPPAFFGGILKMYLLLVIFYYMALCSILLLYFTPLLPVSSPQKMCMCIYYGGFPLPVPRDKGYIQLQNDSKLWGDDLKRNVGGSQ